MVSEVVAAPRFLDRADLGLLLDALHEDGRTVIGPTLADGAIVYDEVRSVDDLPAGWRATESPGHYRLERTAGERLFDLRHGPDDLETMDVPASGADDHDRTSWR